jgi:hypothetical protein
MQALFFKTHCIFFLFFFSCNTRAIMGKKNPKIQSRSLCSVRLEAAGFTGIRPKLSSTSCGPLFW